MRSTWLVLAVLAGALPATLAAQTIRVGRIQPGTRVRLDVQCQTDTTAARRTPSPNRRDQPRSCARYEGILAQVTTDSLAVIVDEARLVLPRSVVQGMWMHLGRQGSATTGALIGGGVGLAAGLATVAGTHCDPGWFEDLCRTSQATAPFAGAGIGAGVGALIGLFIQRDRWGAVSLQ